MNYLMAHRKTDREISFECVLGKDVFLLRRMCGSEAVSELSKFELEFFSEETNVNVEAMLGTSASISVRLPFGGSRRFQGTLARFALTGRQGRFTTYKATMHPWLWYLTHTSDCRVFQERSVTDILESVFADYPMVDLDMSGLSYSYPSYPYCIQYRETDFAFVSRLLEREGIAYFFRNQGDRQTMVLADAYATHTIAPGYKNLLYMPFIDRSIHNSDVIYEWEMSSEVRSDVLATHGETHAHGGVDACRVGHHEVRGATRARGLYPGSLFALTGHYQVNQNCEYMLTDAEYVLSSDIDPSILPAESETMLTTKFKAVPTQGKYYSTLRTPPQVIYGPQSAIVLGKPGEQILADKDGRVKVQFQWAGAGRSNDHTECWVRLAHGCLASRPGCQLQLRAGQEVMVSFLEGDPDRPLVIACIHDGSHMPPFV